MEPVCSVCSCKLTDENRDYHIIGDSKIYETICRKCKEFKPRNRHERRMFKKERNQ